MLSYSPWEERTPWGALKDGEMRCVDQPFHFVDADARNSQIASLWNIIFQKYRVMPKFSDPPLMWMERAATSKLFFSIPDIYYFY